MSRVIIYLPEIEFGALQRLAEQELRTTRAQAAIIIREELMRRNLVAPEIKGTEILQGAAGGTR